MSEIQCMNIQIGNRNFDIYCADVPDKEYKNTCRLIAAAPEMYDAITECSDTLQAIKNANDCNEAVELYDVEELIHSLCELLARIDGDSQED